HHADLLLAERLPSERLTEAVGGSVLRDEASPMISISREGEWEAYLGQRRARKVAGAGVRFRLVSEPAQLPTALDALIALHRARWGERSRAFAGERERFHR